MGATPSLFRTTFLVLVMLCSAGCYGVSRLGPDEDGGPDGATPGPLPEADVPVDGGPPEPDAAPDPTVDAAVSCPAPVTGSAEVTSPVITTDPSSYVDREITVVGILTSSGWSDCDDLGMCGSCSTGLAIDGQIALRGPDGSDSLCDEHLGCVEQVDSCLPRWSCWPFDVGQRVRAQGHWRSGPLTTPAVDEWGEVLQGYYLELTAIEVADSIGGAGLFAGTVQVQAITGECPPIPNSFAIELVVAYAHPGMVVELMDPSSSTVLAEYPVLAGWHVGRLPPDPAPFELQSRWRGLGVMRMLPTVGGFAAEYSLTSPSADGCAVQSTITASQVF